MIAAVDAPCVCLNVADQRTGPLSGAAAPDAEDEVDDDPDAHAATTTITTSITAPDPRIECSIYAKGGAELELRSASQFVCGVFALRDGRLRRSRTAECV